MTPEQHDRWTDIVDAERRFHLACAQLTMPEAIEVLAEVLPEGPGRGTALRMARDMPVERLMELFPQLYQAAITTHSDILLARQILARLDSGWLALALAPEVERTLEHEDWETYRRLAELLDHLGQEALLARVVVAATGSDDEDVREVAEDFDRIGPR